MVATSKKHDDKASAGRTCRDCVREGIIAIFNITLQANGQPITIYDPLTTAATAYSRPPLPGDFIQSNRISPIAAEILSYRPAPTPGNDQRPAPGWFWWTSQQSLPMRFWSKVLALMMVFRTYS
jgi:hypothetical protein